MKHLFFALIMIAFAPLLMSLIARVKAIFAGKVGLPWFFYYHTLLKLLQKTPVISMHTTAIFTTAPLINLAVMLFLFAFLPLANYRPLLSFYGDIFVVIAFLALARIFSLLAAFDTASSFSAMGAARDVFYSMLAEIVLFTIFIIFFRLTNDLSLATFAIEGKIELFARSTFFPLLLVAVSFFMLLLQENARVPIDDPNTHLELTMIDEVKILDYSGPYLAFMQLSLFLKLLFYSCFLANLLFSQSLVTQLCTIALSLDSNSYPLLYAFFKNLIFIALVSAIYIAIAVIESSMARLALKKIPKYSLSALVLAVLAAILMWRNV
ncbi:MAG: NADH-quinone oxidoreductase subunit H [Oligoflexia bacterium]|nr:NADH-quinone oxidoreductase subunit H [Oligoflexia bacterium]MBF0365178.1 NADH-quinone oxidoreductase subunit H [Oligoflexia bacterium]